MKLLLVAIVICARVAAVPFSDAVQSGSSFTRNLRSEGVLVDDTIFGKFFDACLRALFEKHEKKAMSEEAFSKLIESHPPEDNNLLWENVNLLKSEAFLEWISKSMKDEDRAKLVYKMIRKFNSPKKTASIIIAGKMAHNEKARSLAFSLEHCMMDEWAQKNWKLKQALEHLELNDIKNHNILYANPAFTTLLAYAMKLHDKQWKANITRSVPKPENKNYGPEDKVRVHRIFGQLEEKRDKWHIIVQTKKGVDPKV